MSRKIIYLITFFATSFIFYSVFAHINGIAGYVSSPSESSCTASGCHTTYGVNSGPGSITITHNIPASGYVLGTTYAVTVTVAQTGISLFGFDCEALTSANANAGTLVVTNSTRMKLMTAGNGRTNMTFKSGGGAGSSPMAFSFNWVAPSSNVGTVTFYAAGDACNNNGNESGDYVYTTSTSVSASSSTTITTGTITSTSFCAGQTGISIPYTITGTFTSGNVFTAQLSSSTGSFATPTTIGSVTTVSAGTITSSVGLPAVAGTAYRIRVVGSTPATTGSSNSSDLTITLPPTASNAGPDQAVCGTTATLAGNSPTTGTGTWSKISGTGTITNSSLNNSGVTALSVGANAFVWSIYNGTCAASLDTVVITRVDNPTTANAGSDQIACTPNVTLAGNTPTTGTGTWTLLSGTGTITNPNNPATTVTGIGTGVNSFIWTISNSPCNSSRDTVIINHSGTMTASNAGPDQRLCTTTSTTLAANTPTVGTGAWTKVSGSGVLANSSNPASSVTGLSLGANAFVWTISNPPCAPSIDTVVINVVTPPSTANAGADQVVCSNTATLAGNTPSNGSGQWSVLSGSGTISNTANPASTVTGLSLGTNTFVWTISNTPCNPTSDTVIINFTGTITTANAGPTQTICSTTATLAGNTPGVGSGQWSLVSGSGTISNPSNPTTSVTGLGLGDNIFRWTINNPPCTPSTSDVTIHNCTNNTITTGTISGSPFCYNTSYSTLVPFTFTGIFNGYFYAELSDSTGSFANPVVIGASSSSPISVNIPASTLVGTKYRIRVRNSSPVITGSVNSVNLSINTCLPNSITTGTISGSPFCKNTTYTLQVPFSKVGTYTGTYTAQLSDATGLFTNPVNIGTGNSSPVNCTINPATNKGFNYRIRVINSNPYQIGADNGTDIQINTCMVIITDSIVGSPFCAAINLNASIPFHTIGDLTPPYMAELSDVAGSFNTPLTIGYGNSSPIYVTIPKLTATGNNYRIRVNNADGATLIPNSTNILINTCKAGIRNEVFNAVAELYPNPNEGSFNLRFNKGFDQDITITVTDILGREKFSKSLNQIVQGEIQSINLTDAVSGVYFIKINSADFSSTYKFVVTNSRP